MCLWIKKEKVMKILGSNKAIGYTLCLLLVGIAISATVSAQDVFPDNYTDESNALQGRNVIYYNLGLGDVVLTPSVASGYIWTGTKWEKTDNGGAHTHGYYYHIIVDPEKRFQGDPDAFRRAYQYPVTATNGGPVEIVNQKDAVGVLEAWNIAADQLKQAGHRQVSEYQITVSCGDGYYILLDNVWSTYQSSGSSNLSGGLAFHPQKNNAKLRVYLKGDNRLGNVFYTNTILNDSRYTHPDPYPYEGRHDFDKTNIIFYSADPDNKGTLTVGDINPRLDSDVHGANYYNSVIGGSDDRDKENSKGIVFFSGTIFAGATPNDVCSAIGAGGNGEAYVAIHGGSVTAVTSSTGTAIGGGIGWSEWGGKGTVIINNGEVNAYNKGIVRDVDGNPTFVPAAAIGGGSSFFKKCYEATVKIYGGTVRAESVGGVAIGGGGSGFGDGSNAKVSIYGGDITAKSVKGDKNEYGLADDIAPGSSIGGGTGGVGGGEVEEGPGRGGDCEFYMEGGTLKAGSVGGGATLNTDPSVTIGYAVAEITGGTIQAQFVMAKGSSDHCEFSMSDGTIENSQVNNTKGFTLVKDDGGAVWMDDPNGKVRITGGTIQNCKANNGGAVYTTGGEVTVQNATISGCEATTENGGAFAIISSGSTVTLDNAKIIDNTAKKNGGAFYLSPNATVTITNGTIDDNHATTEDGGAFYGSAGSKIILNSGSIERNTARNGAGVYLASGAELTYTTSPTVKGYIRQNHASELGGGVYLAKGSTSDKTELDFIMNSSTSFGFYDNLADVGADDIYAYGEGTTRIEFPSVNGMDLGGYSLFGATLQWWEDYKVDDDRYDVGTEQGDPIVIRRYRASRDALNPIWRVPKVSTDALSNFYEKYLCLTLGFEYGNLEIRRSGLEPRENAIYKIEFVGTELDRPTQYVTVLGTTEDKKTPIDGVAWNIAKVGFLPQGSYKVTEIPWAWYNETTTPTATVKTQDISNEEGRIFRFQNTHIDLGTTPQHDEELKVNDLKP